MPNVDLNRRLPKGSRVGRVCRPKQRLPADRLWPIFLGDSRRESDRKQDENRQVGLRTYFRINSHATQGRDTTNHENRVPSTQNSIFELNSMKFKSKYLVLAMVLFLVVVFLDQNRRPVPLKFIIGTPFLMDLSLIILISMVIGIALTGGCLHFMNRRKKFKGQKSLVENQR